MQVTFCCAKINWQKPLKHRAVFDSQFQPAESIVAEGMSTARENMAAGMGSWLVIFIHIQE